MTRKKFIKQIMALGVTRNTAQAVADAANRAEITLADMADRVRILSSMYLDGGYFLKQKKEIFNMTLLAKAKNTQRSFKPYVKIYEVSLVPSGGYPLGGGGA